MGIAAPPPPSPPLPRAGGTTFAPGQIVDELRAPIEGCEASTARQGDALFFTGPQGELFRERLTLFASDDMGDRWESVQVIDAGPTSYSSLAPMADASLGLLYERSDARRLIFKPDAISFVRIATTPLLRREG